MYLYSVGLNIYHIDGLAALAYRFKKIYNRNNSSFGTMPDKINGLHYAFEVAAKSLPCILHLKIDLELSMNIDDSIRQDEEQRIMTAIRNEYQIIRSFQTRETYDVPLFFMIISTKKGLKNGPISSALIFDAIDINLTRSDDIVGAKKSSPSMIPKVTWEDIGGLSHVRQEIINTIELPLLHHQLFMNSQRSGILLFGPPGSGKTLVAKAVASECGLPFLNVKGPELLGSYVGESESNIRQIFLSARELAAQHRHHSRGTCIIFFDEIDSLAPCRGELVDSGGVMDRVVATLLGEMDNLSSFDSNVIVIGATNRPDLLDPSILRPGRLDRLIYLGLAESRSQRVSLLVAQIRKFHFEGDFDACTIAEEVIDQFPEGLSGADFSAIAKSAVMSAIKRVCECLDQFVSTNKISIDDFIQSNESFDATPRVTSKDLIDAALQTTPSVSEHELKKYLLLQNKYSN